MTRWTVAGSNRPPRTPSREDPAAGGPQLPVRDHGGHALLEVLRELGVEHVFANAGSDIPSVLDAWARFAAEGKSWPQPIQVPHEACGLAMAHGYALATGRPAVALVHSTVGTGNALTGVINASRARIPVVLLAGRTASVETGSPASRTLEPHWAQETADQGALVRPYVKWDYELRSLQQLEQVVRRAFALAMSEPRGPVYLALPMDLMAETLESRESPSGNPGPGRGEAALYGATTTPQPDPRALARVAEAIATAREPLIITRSLGRRPEAVEALVELAESFAVPVVEYQVAEHVNFPSGHPLHLGYDPTPYLGRSDLVLVIECPVPWVPVLAQPAPGARVIHLGTDPLWADYPLWGFRSDLAVAGDPVESVRSLTRELGRRRAGRRTEIDRRAQRHAAEHGRLRRKWLGEAEEAGRQELSSPRWISHCLRAHLSPEVAVVQEYDLKLRHVGFEHAGSYFGFAPSGGLGFGMGGALGVKLARPDKTVISVVGDGTYLLGVPSACHMVSHACDLPVLWIVVNNHGWGAIRTQTLLVHPDGWAQRSGSVPLVRFGCEARFELFAHACGGAGESVRRAADLPAALERALGTLRETGRQVLLNVDCGEPTFNL